MKIKVISLISSQDRRNSFIESNKHLKYEFFDAVNGNDLSEDVYYNSDLINWDGLNYNNPAIGCALSHLTLWNECINTNQPITILEDDAITRFDFEQKHKQIIDELPEDWDIIYWGWNFDSIIKVKFAQSNISINLTADNKKLYTPNIIKQFQQSIVPVSVFDVQNLWGTCSYSISPKGAKYFKEKCFPLTNKSYPFIIYPRYDQVIVNTAGIDATMNSFFHDSKVYMTFPSLSLTLNDRNLSTINKI